MTPSRRLSCAAAATVLLAAAVHAVLLAPSARAQSAPPFATDEFSGFTFHPVPGGSYLGLESAEVSGRFLPRLALTFDYAARPIGVRTACPDDTVIACTLVGNLAEIMKSSATFQLGTALALGDRLELSLLVPLAFVSGEGMPYVVDGMSNNDISGGSSVALADPRVGARLHLMGSRERHFALGASAYVGLPLGRVTAERHYAGDEGLNAGGSIIAEAYAGRFAFAANLGAFYRPNAALIGVKTGPGMSYGVGVTARLHEFWGVAAELMGTTGFGETTDALEARLLGRSYFHELTFGLGGGVGIVRGPGVPVARVLASVTWSPEADSDTDGDGIDDPVDACPAVAEDQDSFEDEDGCPDADNDRDGLEDAQDHCPNEAEDRDEHDDEDGCPDADNDGDGVVDGYDSCPDRAEDMDGDRDRDGCPDVDADRDGIDDGTDQCTDRAEDHDNIQDFDGCPETDADNDGVLDRVDQCPTEAGPRGGRASGCPATPPANGGSTPSTAPSSRSNALP